MNLLIVLQVVLIFHGNADGKGWTVGQYSWTTGTFATVAECTEKRGKLIERAMSTPDSMMLIGECGTEQDRMILRGYMMPPDERLKPEPETPEKPNT